MDARRILVAVALVILSALAITFSAFSTRDHRTIVSSIDWVILWRLFHYQFFFIYLSLGIPIRFFAARTFGAASLCKKSFSVAVASLVSSVFSTWLPIVPILGVGVPLAYLGKADVGNSFLIGVPLVAISMGIETALLDAVLFRLLLKESAKGAIYALLIANIFNASIALALGLAWAFHHLPIFEATVNGCCSP